MVLVSTSPNPRVSATVFGCNTVLDVRLTEFDGHLELLLVLT